MLLYSRTDAILIEALPSYSSLIWSPLPRLEQGTIGHAAEMVDVRVLRLLSSGTQIVLYDPPISPLGRLWVDSIWLTVVRVEMRENWAYFLEKNSGASVRVASST